MIRMLIRIVISILLFSAMPVFAANASDRLDYQDIQDAMDEMLPKEMEISFAELVQKLVSGDFNGIGKILKTYISHQFLYEIQTNRGILAQMIGIILISAVFTNFSMAFSKAYIAETGFYLTYMLLFTLLLASFMTAVDLAMNVISHMIKFMSALVPVFCLAITLTGNIQTGIWYQQMMVAGITLIEWIVSKGIINLVHIYVLLSLVNHLSKEDVLSKCAELIKTVAVWATRTVIGVILGLHFIQGLVLPAYDTLKNGWTARFASALPGVGDTMGSVLQTVVGSAVLIKNGIGSAGLIVLTLIFFIPMIKLVIMVLMYLLAQAIVQPVADKRMIECLHCVSDGILLLLKIEGTVFVLFFLSMAMMTSASGAVFGG